MRVLHVTSVFAPTTGGIQTYIRDLSAYLKSEHAVDSQVCYCIADSNFLPPSYTANGIKVSTVVCRGNSFYKWLPDMSRWVDQCDVIHLHDNQIDGICLHFALRRYGKPVIITTHGGFLHQKKMLLAKRVYARLVAPYVLRRLDAVIASGPNDEITFRKMTNNVVRVDNGIDFKHFNGFATTSIETAPVFLTVGRIATHKRVDRLVEILTCLHQVGRRVHLHIVGKDADNVLPHLIDMVSAAQIEDYVQLSGGLNGDAFGAAFSNARFFITATEYEGFGLAIVEAMAAGLIPLVNRISPLTEIVSDGVDGFLIDFADTAVATQQLLKILDMPVDQLDCIREASINRARDFSWSKVARQIMDVYRSGLEKPEFKAAYSKLRGHADEARSP